MPNVQIPPGLSESQDVDHDQTQGGTEGNPHGDSAASADVSSIQSSGDVDHNNTSGGTTGNPHADSAASADVSSIQSSGDVNHDNTSGGTAGNPHASSASTNHGNAAHSASFETDSGAQSRVDSHENKNNPHSASADTNHGNAAHNTTFAVDGNAQPPENHGNGAHTSNYITDPGVTSVNGQSGSVSIQTLTEGFDTVSENVGFGTYPAGEKFVDINIGSGTFVGGSDITVQMDGDVGGTLEFRADGETVASFDLANASTNQTLTASFSSGEAYARSSITAVVTQEVDVGAPDRAFDITVNYQFLN